MVRLQIVIVSLLVTMFSAVARADRPPTSPAEDARGEIRAAFGFVPRFIRAIPERALPGAWLELKSVQMNPRTALPGKVKELIGLAVAAQIPCRYCVYAHTEFARLQGATDAEVGEAVAVAALARHWSTFLNGIQTDEKAFRAEIARLVDHVKKMAAGAVPPPRPMVVTDRASALADIRQGFGSVPDFLKKFPEAGLAGAWIELRDVELDPKTALPGKYKSLIGLAVASQIPCRFCVIADTELARLEGASQQEIAEAIAMAAIVRHWSTFLNGLQIDEVGFRKDVDRLVRNARKMAATGAATRHQIAARAAAVSGRRGGTGRTGTPRR